MYVSFRISPHYTPPSFHRLKPFLAAERSVLKNFCQSLSDSKTKTVDTDNLSLVIFERLHEVPWVKLAPRGGGRRFERAGIRTSARQPLGWQNLAVHARDQALATL